MSSSHGSTLRQGMGDERSGRPGPNPSLTARLLHSGRPAVLEGHEDIRSGLHRPHGLSAVPPAL